MGEGKPRVSGPSWAQGLWHIGFPKVRALEGIRQTVEAEEDLRDSPVSLSTLRLLGAHLHSELRPWNQTTPLP